MPGARDLRLRSDYENLMLLAERSGGRLVVESTRGNPPEEYVLVYHCRTIERLEGERPIYREFSRVHIKLTARYPAPSAPPVVSVLTPIYHPHVFLNGNVCLGSWETSEYLDLFARRLGAMLQFDRRFLNVHDPANEEAIFWTHRNLALFPTDDCDFGELPESAPIVEEGAISWTEVPLE